MGMYYDDLTEMWSSFSALVDVAEREHRLRLAEKRNPTTNVSEEEKVNCSFWDLVPRKKRSSLMNYLTRRNPKICFRDLIGSSTSSSLFRQDPQNPPSSENTETENQPSANSPHSSPTSCVTRNKSRKRPATEQRKSSVGFKKAKTVDTPVWLDHVMSEMKGGATDPKLIFEKMLYATDVNPGQSRLSLPFNKLIRSDFLTPQESGIIEEDINNNEKTGVGAIMVDQRCEKWGVMLKRWEMKKESGKGSYSYALNCGWNEIVEANELRAGDRISLWSLRWRGVLCFALVPPPPPSSGHNSSALSL